MSLDAAQPTLTWLQPDAVAERPMGTDGGVVSGQAGVFVVAALLRSDSLPALSTAETV